ncbi:hotdog fold thioesterase [Flavobacterium sp. NST-5]|uniref:Hotdog fold thioesterase n=1 Tax=Flavobacterium ichthyis TaxID=2698827 RepID=A0ABW9Z533_9FLAO|nr:hotdog fold thioesterase [Flavobacterium ichthyis]NBL63953.1 hotdog fold thioesterase [Flavobacterium ichthyis]
MITDKHTMIENCKKWCQNTLMETLEIEFIEAGEGFLKAKMPVNSRVHQPMGLLHGGASVALAESVGSAASLMFIDVEKQEVRGIEISANHVKSKRAGTVFGTAKIIHKGRMVHLWEIRITDENDELVSLCKLTNIVLDRIKK